VRRFPTIAALSMLALASLAIAAVAGCGPDTIDVAKSDPPRSSTAP